MPIEIHIKSAQWAKIDLDAIAEAAGQATLGLLGLDSDPVSLAILATDDAEIAKLNAEFRKKPVPTNVLSWPVKDLAASVAGGQPALPQADVFGEIELGDIAISFETCAREADTAGKPMSDHVTHLIVHGVLHLLGYDHIRDPDATLMQAREVEILGRLGIDDPYWDRDGA
ncbi:rRNA maturation RNase YbeY [Sedimentitalea todarodis]|uniref:Endoribonuclease YbeY n=1 Tax=Sedimentitalea todarodis TaxID=1631240 RepID=A0ABU3VD44_9RHOB|nr:rRNA maturation RNase YbeY [Sedimentitalea todarodis]MDU9004074.1 rRNA maturation RNase YbeY [Sedimentitalea todarodis]